MLRFTYIWLAAALSARIAEPLPLCPAQTHPIYHGQPPSSPARLRRHRVTLAASEETGEEDADEEKPIQINDDWRKVRAGLVRFAVRYVDF